MSQISLDKLRKIVSRDYQIPQSRVIGHRVLIAANLMMIFTIIIELLFDLDATSIQLLIPSFLLNFILLVISYSNKTIRNLEIAHIVFLYIIVEVHFFTNPGVFHILVYWMPFLPMHALITRGIKSSQWWVLLTGLTILVNGYYGSEFIGGSYSIAPDYLKFSSAGVLYLLCVYTGFYLLYYLLGNAYSNMKDKNKEIRRLNKELRQLNNSLEERVHERTKDINEKNARLEKIAYMNSHEVRSSLSKIMSASEAINLDEGEKERMLEIMVDSSKDLDQAIKAMNKEIEQQD